MLPVTRTVLEAVLGIAVAGLPGLIGGLKGVLDQEFVKRLAKFIMDFLQPCFIFATFGSRLTVERLQKVWPLTVWSCIQIAAGICVANVVERVMGGFWNRGQRGPVGAALPRLFQLSTCFANISGFSIPLVQTLCHAPGLFEGHAQTCFDDGVLMIFGFCVPWEIAFWTQGYAAVRSLRDPCSTVLKAENGAVSVSGTLFAKLVNPVFAAMFLGALVGLCEPARWLLFADDGYLYAVGNGIKRVGGIVPVLALQVLTATLGVFARRIYIRENSSNEGVLPDILPDFTSADKPRRFYCVRRRAKAGVDDVTTSKSNSAPPASAEKQKVVNWIATSVASKLIIMPCVGVLLCSLAGRITERTSDASALLPVDDTQASNTFLACFFLLWPQDRLLRVLVMMQWSAPSCLSLISMCYRCNLSNEITNAVASLYLVMYSSVVVTTTFWVSVAFLLF